MLMDRPVQILLNVKTLKMLPLRRIAMNILLVVSISKMNAILKLHHVMNYYSHLESYLTL